MGATMAADFVFTPKVWKDHIAAYFDKKLVFGAFALQDRTLTGAPGTTQSFPYFKAIGAAEEPAEDEALTVDKLADDSFTCTVKEVGKAVGVRKGALRKSAATQEAIFAETQAQIGRVMAEKVDADLITEINTGGSYVSGYVSADATDANRMTVKNIVTARHVGFGDKQDQSVVMFMHSLNHLDLLNVSSAGSLTANANDPFANVPGFVGRLLGMAVVITDQCPLASPIGSKLTYYAFICKANAYGLMIAEDMEMEMDKDILHREWIFTGTNWYGVKSFHAKINALDKKIVRMTVASSVAA